MLNNIKSISSEPLVLNDNILQSVLNTVLDGIMIINNKGYIEYINPAACKLFQYSDYEVVGKKINNLMPYKYASEHDEYINNYITTGIRKVIGKTRLVEGLKKDGTTFPLELGVSDITLEGSKYFVGTVKDHSERDKKERYIRLISKIQQMYIEKSSLADIFEVILDFMINITNSEYGFIGGVYEDKSGKYLKTYAITNIAWNDETEKFYQQNVEQGLEFRNLNSLFGYTLKTEQAVVTNDAKNDHRAGGLPKDHPKLDKYIGIPIKGNDNKMIGMFGLANGKYGYSDEIVKELSKLISVMASIIESSKNLALIETMANTDSLTGVFNRNYFNKHIVNKVNASKEVLNKSDFAIMMIDCNNFKKINDYYGHDAGDYILHKVANILKKSIRSSDFVARIGGDEFVVVIDNIKSQSGVEKIANKISKSCQQAVIFKGKNIHYSLSIGIALYNNKTDSEEIIKHADLALYEAKKLNLNHYTFTKSLKGRFLLEQKLETFILKAFQDDLFYFHFQPKVSLNNNHLYGFEALLRCDMPDGLNFNTQELINQIKKLGLSEKLNIYAVEKVIKYMELYSINKSISINISPYVKNFIKHLEGIVEIIDKSFLPNSLFELELLEDAFGDSITLEENYQISNILKKKNIKLSIDDFGVRYSSINRLVDYHIDILKIDQSFIRSIDNDKRKQVVVKAILEITKSLNITSVAEGVETQEYANILKDMGCDYGQGYLYSKPLSISDTMNFIKKYTID